MKSAAYVMWPLLNGREWDLTIAVDGHQAKPGEDMQVYYNLVSPGYWQAMGIPLLQGRDFDERDRVDGGDDPQPWTVAIVNREFAEHFFAAQDPIGRLIGCCHGPGTKPSIRIVGVVENSLFGGPRAGVRRQVFLPYLESATPAAVTFYVRTTKPSAAMFATLRGIVAKLDRSLPMYDLKTLENQLDETLSTERLIASVSAVFGVLATVLAALGLYGVMAFAVARRTREIGLRMALGAPRSWVLWTVMREVLILLGEGLIVGVPGAYVLSSYVSSQLFGVTPTDVWTGASALQFWAWWRSFPSLSRRGGRRLSILLRLCDTNDAIAIVLLPAHVSEAETDNAFMTSRRSARPPLVFCVLPCEWSAVFAQTQETVVPPGVSISHFAHIDAQVYVGSKPRTDEDFEFLQSQHIKFILNARFLPFLSGLEKRKAKRYGMTFLSVPMNASPIPPSQKHVNQILLTLKDPRFQPIYLHCVLGRDRTGLITGLYRIYFLKVSRREAWEEMWRPDSRPGGSFMA